jgi:hypothetical protein
MTNPPPTPTPQVRRISGNIWKVLVGVVITIVLVAFAPHFAASLGLIAPIAQNAWLILLVTAVGLSLKALLSDVAAGEFLFYKFGYDNCVMTFGAALTALALQLLELEKKHDLFPGLNAVVGLKSLPTLSSDPASNRSIQLAVFLLIVLVLTVLTAKIAAAIKHDNPGGQGLLSFLNSLIGTVVLGAYVLMLVTKG